MDINKERKKREKVSEQIKMEEYEERDSKDNLRKGKSRGKDTIQNETWIYSTDTVVNNLCEIINEM